MRKFSRSFRWACDGLLYTIRTQRNMRIHILISAVVILLGFALGISRVEWALIFLTISLVMVAEIINTAFEKVVDMITEEFHPLARIVKNSAAGAVLLAALCAVIIGSIIFGPYLIGLLHSRGGLN